eukprot:SAG22_NODE_273_length_13182_cov_12.693419_3_plen_405_part_00
MAQMKLLLPLLLLAPEAGAAAAGLEGGTCPAGWARRPGVCLWPKQQAFANLSVVGVEDEGGACCAACASNPRCVSWLVYTAAEDKFPAGTCILNDAPVMGQAPAEPGCISGIKPPPHWPPAPPPAPAPPGAKNVLFFAVDDLRPEITAFGGPNAIPGTHTPPLHTPNFDALAARSLVLTKNYVQQAVCSPTRTSLLTGRRPDRTRVYDLYSYFRDVAANYTTIPEFFLRHGYKSIGMGKVLTADLLGAFLLLSRLCLLPSAPPPPPTAAASLSLVLLSAALPAALCPPPLCHRPSLLAPSFRYSTRVTRPGQPARVVGMTAVAAGRTQASTSTPRTWDTGRVPTRRSAAIWVTRGRRCRRRPRQPIHCRTTRLPIMLSAGSVGWPRRRRAVTPVPSSWLSVSTR